MRRIAAVLAAAILSSGCLVVSLQPVYDDRSVAFDDALVGKWTNKEDRTTVTIDRAEWRSYKIVYSDRSATFALYGNLTQIGTAWFVDVTQSRGSDPGPYLVPVHGIYRIAVKDDTLTASALDYGWFVRAMDARAPGSLAASFDDRRNVTIASATDQLRAWLEKAPDDAFAAAATYMRGGAQ